jgi:hypothetical protein
MHHSTTGKLSALEIFSAADNNLEMIREGTVNYFIVLFEFLHCRL